MKRHVFGPAERTRGGHYAQTCERCGCRRRLVWFTRAPAMLVTHVHLFAKPGREEWTDTKFRCVDVLPDLGRKGVLTA